ncbi:MAG: hypothetical protein RLY31_731 [Bacteroidota bacterium]|jgi:ATP-binding protein involved in chromosome partitioning
MEMDKQRIVDALYQVKDPATGKDLIKARMVENLEISGRQVNFQLILPSLGSPHKQTIIMECMAAIRGVYPDAEVNPHVMAKAAGGAGGTSALPHVRNIIAVASGKGGVGKSTVSVNLALALQQLGAKVGIVDADLYGPSIPLMLGLQGQRPKVQEVHGQPKIIPLTAHGMPVISIGFIIEPEQAVVLRGPRLAGIIKQFFNDVIWPDLDYLVVDLPPGTGDIQLTLVQTVPVTGAIMVTTPQEVAVADALKAMNMFLLPSVNVPILGIVENMAWFTPEDMPDRKYFIFGEGGGKKMVQLSRSMLLGQIPIVQGIREGGDSGQPVTVRADSPVRQAFRQVAENTLRQVAVRHEMLGPTQVVQVE